MTGGDSGIGRAVAIAFAREGADVLIAFRTAESEAAETARWVEKAGRRAILVGGNLEGEPQQKQIVEQAIAQFGHLDILVNDAVADWPHEAAQRLSALDLEQALRKSTEAVFGFARIAASRMQPGASIITTTALRFSHPSFEQRAYGAFQGGVAALTASLATELARKGIRINAVEPGPVWAPRVLATLTDEQRRSFGADTLLGRPGQPAELAPAYVFLASAEASFVTGSVLPVTGGWFDRHPSS